MLNGGGKEMQEEEATTYHTYEFLKKRKDDPKWKDQYLQRKEERELSTLYRILFFMICLNILIWGYGIFRYFFII